jgi:predicted ArsR family transcriptional regulator
MQTSRKSTASPTNARSKPPAPQKVKSKKDQLITLLRTKGGADIQQLTKALGWLPHTVRAALTGLRKSGLTVERIAGKGGGPARYSIASKPERAR